jgi:hypothetical protein
MCANDELLVALAELQQYRAELRRAEVEQNNLRAALAEALAQIEHWRTLAEYRKSRLVERQDSPGEPPLVRDRRRPRPARRSGDAG